MGLLVVIVHMQVGMVDLVEVDREVQEQVVEVDIQEVMEVIHVHQVMEVSQEVVEVDHIILVQIKLMEHCIIMIMVIVI